MKYFWLQVRARAGNWVDNLGTEDKGAAIQHGRFLRDRQNETVRVVTRRDTVIWDGKNDSVRYKANPSRRAVGRMAPRGVHGKMAAGRSRYVNRKSQITRRAPRPRLKKRRSKQWDAGRPRGFFANPENQAPRMSRSTYAPYAKVDTRGGGFEYGMDAVTPVSWILGRARVLPKGRYVWWLADTPAVHAFVKANPRIIATKNELVRKLNALPSDGFTRRTRRVTARQNPQRSAMVQLIGARSGKLRGTIRGKCAPGELARLARKCANACGEAVRVVHARQNPEPREEMIRDAANRAKSFGLAPKGYRNTPFPRDPGAAFDVGPVMLIGYETVRDGRREKYVHEFKRHARPHLAVSHDGRSLYLLGGAYRFTERGIVDRRDS